MISLLGAFDYLREIILATAAMHKVALHRAHGLPHRQELVDALAAKGRAYRLLRRALDDLDPANKPIVLIAVVFFINFDLIDSGRGSWKMHIEAAGNIITSITSLGSSLDLPPSVAQLADVVVADCITYYALGSLFTRLDRSGTSTMSAFAAVDLPATLQRAAAFSYGCSPPLVLDALSRAARLRPDDVPGAAALLARLRALDVGAWVRGIQGLPPRDDLALRVAMADAHRAAACLYIVLAVPGAAAAAAAAASGAYSSFSPPPSHSFDAATDALLQEILGHLASVPIEHALAKGVTWPTFVAGAQARDAASRRWCMGRLHAVWHSTPWACPWGFIESAMDMLQRIWHIRDAKAARDGHERDANWLQEVRGMADHCLIV